jgi:hypothetical protein
MLKESAVRLRETEFFLQNSVSLHNLLNERPCLVCHLPNPWFRQLTYHASRFPLPRFYRHIARRWGGIHTVVEISIQLAHRFDSFFRSSGAQCVTLSTGVKSDHSIAIGFVRVLVIRIICVICLIGDSACFASRCGIGSIMMPSPQTLISVNLSHIIL